MRYCRPSWEVGQGAKELCQKGLNFFPGGIYQITLSIPPSADPAPACWHSTTLSKEKRVQQTLSELNDSLQGLVYWLTLYSFPVCEFLLNSFIWISLFLDTLGGFSIPGSSYSQKRGLVAGCRKYGVCWHKLILVLLSKSWSQPAFICVFEFIFC